ncbi:MAG: hypothetical protein U0800_11050 [Isosphaeraceae bacterium]
MELSGRLAGRSCWSSTTATAWRMSDMVLRRPIGTTAAWDDLARSAALETANVGCALLNSLASHLPMSGSAAIVPSPPAFRHEYAGSLLPSSP